MVESLWRSRSKSSGRGMAFLGCFSLLLLRTWGRVTHPELWAEDGSKFLKFVLELGTEAWITPWGSYYHFLQMLSMWSFLHLSPISSVPLVIHLFSLLMIAAIASQVVKKEYAWLLPSPSWRVALSFAFVLVPGLTEMVGNLCNLNWFLTCYLAFLALKDPKTSFTPLEVGSIFLVLASTGTAIVTLPLFLLRAYLSKRRTALTVFFTLGVAALYVILLQGVRDPYMSGGVDIEAGKWFSVYLRNLRISVLLQPLFGDDLTIRLSSLKWRSLGGIICYLLAGALLVAFIKNIKKPESQALLLFVLSFSAWLFLVWYGRRGSLETFESVPSQWFFAHRYSFPITWPSLLLWWVVAYQLSQTLTRSVALPFVLVLLLILLNKYRFFIPALGPERFWKNDYQNLETYLRTGCPKDVRIRVYPSDNFYLNFHSPSELNCAQTL